MMIRPLFCAVLLACVAVVPAIAQEAPPANLEKSVIKLFQATYKDYCDVSEDSGPLADKVERFDFTYIRSYEPETGKVTLPVFRVACAQGAYNLQHVYFWWREYDGLRPLLFAVPTFVTKFENDDADNGKLLSLDVTGFTTQAIMVNDEVGLSTGQISDNALWRGLGDASSQGIWTLDDGDFRLAKYQIDPSYNGKIDPKTVVDYPMP